ncbi:MAG: ferrous iron transport protein B [Acidobacteriota bacterium]|nr:ferrous iron transport protein B [Acidobacteriota bacterium]
MKATNTQTIENPRSAVHNPQLTVALAGNPNAGKTTLFNALTGLRQKVANFSGVTVERKEGNWKVGDEDIKLIDLPGLYSLDATSLDEQIAREVLMGRLADLPKPDAIIAVVDATNLERNLYLVTQLLEYGIPVVIALTMVDLAEKQNLEIDTKKLSKLLKIPVIEIKAKQKTGINELAGKVLESAKSIEKPKTNWIANGNGFHEANKEDIHLSLTDNQAANKQIFARYAFISEVYQKSVKPVDESEAKFSEKIDRILTHKFFGLVILVAILLLVFQTIFTWAALPMDLLDAGFGSLGEFVGNQMSQGILRDLIVDGIIAGVGGILIFLPQILLLFLFISILEDTGYMARAAFLLDKLMSRVGLHGKAFLPLMSSFACAIPGIMATRTIENRRDRLATIMIAPFMSCSARLPVYALMIAAFFAGQTVFGFISLGAVLMLAMYSLGIFVAVIAAFVLKKTILKSPPPPFVMELPPYRLPNLRTVIQNMFTRAWLFIKRAGTIILAISIILWALMYFPRSEEKSTISSQQATVESQTGSNSGSPIIEDQIVSNQLENSYAGTLGRTFEPVIAPLGFDWKIGVALIASFAAREVLVSTLSIIYNIGDDATEESPTLINAIRNAKKSDGSKVWTPLTALSLMVFFVLAMQCMSTLAIVRRETNSWSWVIFMFGYMTVLAYIASLLTYQGGRFLGFS